MEFPRDKSKREQQCRRKPKFALVPPNLEVSEGNLQPNSKVPPDLEVPEGNLQPNLELPECILEVILSRLPVKSLILFSRMIIESKQSV